jgi:hypothetical protein
MHRNSEDVRQAEGQKRVDRRLQAKPQAWLIEQVVETGHVALPGLKLRIWLNGPAADLEPIVLC